MSKHLTVGVLALQGAFHEHIKLLTQASASFAIDGDVRWRFVEVRTPVELDACNALIIPGGESTTVSLVAARTGLLEPLRDFVKAKRRPTWGTCAGLILLAESANKTKKGGQELIGGLDVRVNRNYFGRQTESFEAPLDLAFLQKARTDVESSETTRPFNGIFIRAPAVERLLPSVPGEQKGEAAVEGTVIAPSKGPTTPVNQVEIMATIPGRSNALRAKLEALRLEDEAGDIVAVRQGNVFGTSFHPELTKDARIHFWWLKSVMEAVDAGQDSLDISSAI
ncbi:MAG: Senecionine N-oxygenase [Ramalina farinacea]|uniref:glutaminase n=1 Tax=Ramalina farinacea TaxID=258253 RepID=A0AA43TRS7_9LECA|nr:Senecionine N-oxygenase [Ramalina farinacea]